MPDPTIGDACIPLLKGIVYADSDATAWRALLTIPAAVRDHLAPLGLEVHIDEGEGYAFLLPIETADDEPEQPRLIARRRLSYRVSLLLALLRRRLMEFDAQGDETRLIITRDDTMELVRTYHPNRANEAKLADEVQADLRKVADLGFVRQLRDQPHTYEVRRILKAFIDAQWLSDFDAHLARYLEAQS